MDFASLLPLQAAYFQPLPTNPYAFGLFPQNMGYNLPYYQSSPSFAYYLSNPTTFAQSQVNAPPSTNADPQSSEAEAGSIALKSPNLGNVKSSQNVIKYAKKNAESNVINQIFSFISIRGKSERVLSHLLGHNEQQINLYYLVMKQLKKHNRKYINRNYIKSLLEMQADHVVHSILVKSDPRRRIGVELLRRVLRILIKYYMRNVCINAILTSSKLDRFTKNEHLQRRTEVYAFLMYHIRNSAEIK